VADERHHNSGTGVGGQLPPWLRGVPLPARPSTDSSHSEESAVSATADASALPDWLRELQPTGEPEAREEPPREQASEAQAEAMPNWLANLQTDTSAASQPTQKAQDEPASDMPDWLRAISQEAEAATPQVPSTPAPSTPEPSSSGFQMPVGATDWLRSLGEEPSPTNQQATPPSAPEPPAPQAAQSDAADDGIPAWLKDADAKDTNVDFDFGAAEPVQPDAAPAQDDDGIPAWLKDADAKDTNVDFDFGAAEPVQPDAAPAQDDDGIPAWLKDADAKEPNLDFDFGTPEPAQPAAAPAQDDDGIPAWLKDADAKEPNLDFDFDAPEPAQSASTPSDSDDLESDKQVPSWLAPESNEAPAQADEGDIPAWLRNAAAPPAFDVNEELWEDESAAQPPAQTPSLSEQSASEEASLPSWLVDSQNPSQAEASPSAQTSEDLPAWLRDSNQSEDPPSAPAATSGIEELPAWLRDSSTSEAASSSAPASAGGNEQLPAWLRESDANDQVDLPTQTTQASEELPPWLRDADLSTDEQSASQSQAASTGEDLPDWLKPDNAGANSAGQSSLSVDPSQSGGDLPDWLKPDSAADDTSSSSLVADPSQSGDDLPDWLKPDSAAVNEASQASPSFDPAESGDDLPDWLKPDSAAVNAASQLSAPIEPSPAESGDDLPDWLSGDSAKADPQAPANDADLPDWLRPSTASDASGLRSNTNANDLPDWLQNDSSSSNVQSGGLPAWLQGAEPENRRAPEPPPVRQSDSTLPPWLQDDEEEQIEIVQGPEGPSGASGDFLGLGEDLPSWLSPTEAAKAEKTEQAAGETYSDWLARLRAQQQEEEVESEPAPGLEETGAVSAIKRPVYSVRPERVEAIALLNRMVAQPFPSSEVVVEPERTKLKQSVIEKVCYALLALALIASLVVPGITNSFQGSVAAPAIDQLISSLDGLNENDVVLVGYEWDARRMGEMEALERAVMDHLAEHRVKFVFVSTDLQGTLLASYQRNRLLNEFGYEPGGIDYILLGYRPGGELALRQMAQNLPQVLVSSPLGEDVLKSVVIAGMDSDSDARIQHVTDFSAVIVLADEAQDVQSWFEQIRPAMNREQPLVFITPSEAAPIVQPYMRATNVFNLAGRQQALLYEQQRGSITSAEASASLGQLSFTIASFVALVVLGALINWIAAVMQRRRKA
jgi:hypothetical protein